MGKYRKKPVVIEAFKWTVGPDQEDDPIWIIEAIKTGNVVIHCPGQFEEGEPFMSIETLEGTMTANIGDYIIQGIKGEIYPCKPDIFENTYDNASVAVTVTNNYERIITVQKREKLNSVFAIDKKGNGGANHKYLIQGFNGAFETEIQMQDGARNIEGSIHGIIDSDLIEIVKHRLEAFQNGPFSSRENAIVITKLEEALMWMNRRVEDRIERNVLGTNQK